MKNEASSLVISYFHLIICDYIGMSYTNMLMRMSHWDRGLSDWMWNILMIGDYAVELHLVMITYTCLS